MPDRRRILYVQPNSEVGGSDICLLRLVRALDRNLYDPIVLLPGEGPMVAMYQQAGAVVQFIPMRQLRTKLSPWYQLNYLARFWPTVFRIARLIADQKIDLVHSNSLYCPYGAFAAKLKGRPHIWHLRELPPQVPILTAMYALMVRMLSTKIASMTRGCAERLFGALNVPETVIVLHDGIDTVEFTPDADGNSVRAELGLTPVLRYSEELGRAGENPALRSTSEPAFRSTSEPAFRSTSEPAFRSTSEPAFRSTSEPAFPLIGFVARLDPWKGLDVFLHSAAAVRKNVPSAKFVVAGGAPSGYESYADRMKQLATSLSLDDAVQFVGFRYGAEGMPRLMAAFDVFVHTAIEPEPFGLVLIEAMACGRPVVAAKAGGPLEIVVDGETGILVKPGDIAGYTEAITKLLSDPAMAAAMGTAGRARAAEVFSVGRFSAGLADLYDPVFGTK